MSSIKEMFDSTTPSNKSGLIIGAVSIFIITFIAIYWVMSENYAVLFKDMEPQDAASIVNELEGRDIPFKLQDSGRTILISENDVHRVRLQLMNSEARLIGGIGFELFDDSDFGMTEFVQKINYQRALQGELTRTITSLDEIKYARVHLVLPENSLFKKDEKNASASITLFVKDGNKLTEKQVSGIQRLVASSVPGMELSSVSISNQNGVVLSQNMSEDDGSATVSQRLRIRKEVESYLTQKAMKILEATFGIDQAVVSVDVALNLNKVQSTMENVIPSKEEKKGVVKKRETKNQSAKKQDSVTTEVEYRLGRKVDQIVTMPGNIEHLTIGVLVPTDTTNQRILQIEELVAMAVGLDKQRGDEIVVHAVGLPKNIDTAKNADMFPKTSYKRYVDQSMIDEAFSKAKLKSKKELQLATAGEPNAMLANGDTLLNDVEEVPGTGRGYLDSLLRLLSLEGESSEQIKYLIMVKYKELIILAMIVLVILLIASIKIFSSKNKENLSPIEREEILKQLQIWLNTDNNKRALEEVKP